jgi:hypothetical protein
VQVDGSRAERELGWRAETPFREGVRRYIAWHRENEATEDSTERVALRASLKAAARTAAALLMSAFAGIGAAGIATLNHPDDAADRAAYVAVIVLLMFPLGLVADLDWDGARRRAIASLVTMGVVATVAASIFPTPAYVARLVDAHHWGTGLLAVCAVVAFVLARRVIRPGRPSASDSAA